MSERGWRRTIDGIADGSKPDDCIFVATETEVVVGIAACAYASEERTVSVGALYVLSSHQRSQIGSRLLETVLARYTGLGAKAVHIAVLAANQPARRFYEAMGGRFGWEREFDEEWEMLPEVVYVWDLVPD